MPDTLWAPARRPGFANFSSIFGRSRTARTNETFVLLFPSPYPIRYFFSFFFLFVLSFVEPRPRDVDDRTRRRRERERKRSDPASRKARLTFGADGTPRIVSPRGETRENYGKICFITSVRNAYGWVDAPLSSSLSLSFSLSLSLFSRFVHGLPLPLLFRVEVSRA